MKNTLIVLSIFFVFTLQLHARDVIQNGSDASRQNILFVYDKLDKYITTCFQTESCKLTSKQYEILSKILNGLPQEKLNRNQIQFESESAHPGFFIIDNSVKKAKTGSKVGGSIYINSDVLEIKSEQGVYEPFSIEQSIALLIHELGHHYGNYSHEELDLLGVKVASTVQMRIYSTPALPWNNQVYAIVVNSADYTTSPDVLIYIFSEIIDISKNVSSFLTCQNGTTIATVLYNLHWLNPSSNLDGNYMIQSNGVITCNNYNGQVSNNFLLNIEFNVQQNKYSKGSLKITRLP